MMKSAVAAAVSAIANVALCVGVSVAAYIVVGILSVPLAQR